MSVVQSLDGFGGEVVELVVGAIDTEPQGSADHLREAVVLTDLHALLTTGQTPDQIAAALNRLGPDWRTRSGKPRTPANISRVARAEVTIR